MKFIKFAPYLILVFLLLSFKVFKDASITNKDPIIGTWVLEKIIYNFNNKASEEKFIRPCDNHKQYVYQSNGTVLFKTYRYNNKTDACDTPGNDHWKGTWKRLKNNIYKRHLTYYYEDRIQSKWEDSTDIFIFSDNNNILKKITNYKESGIVIDSNSRRVSEYAVFKRLK